MKPAQITSLPRSQTAGSPFEARLAATYGASAGAHLEEHGFVALPSVLTGDECAALIASYADDRLFRKTVVMARHGFGRGEYRYFAAPLPPLVAELRAALYRRLAPAANHFFERLGMTRRFPAELEPCLAQSHAAGQRLPTPLLLRYGPGDYNCLHQDLYGEFWFPLQAAVLLDEPGTDFEGGEFVLVEQRPRMQSRPIVVPLRRGDAVVFPVNHRPRRGARGYHRTTMRHGVSEVRDGHRHVLGLIFHDAAT